MFERAYNPKSVFSIYGKGTTDNGKRALQSPFAPMNKKDVI